MTAYGGIAFLTDYGLEDAFVAACHGVLLDLAPSAPVVDVTHLVPPQDVRRGADVLANAAPYLSAMVLVAVVDPGVGGERRPVALEAGDSVLVGPDNGLLLPAADRLGGPRRAVVLDRPDLFLHPVSATFHGRDIFCPVAARVHGGLALDEAGTPVDVGSLHRLPPPVSRWGTGWLEAEIVHVDRFGNVALAAGQDELDRIGSVPGGTVEVSPVGAGPADTGAVGGGVGEPLRATVGHRFTSVPAGEVVVHVDSDRRVAVAVNLGRADDRLGVRAGDVVRVRACGPRG
jgi:S-adenosyl-L-methionine hydrolase (adenosine-forming)